MDIITQSFFDEFVSQYGYQSKREDDRFELFAIYCIVANNARKDSISKDILDDIQIGGGHDWGIDGIMIVVNGKIVTSSQVVDDLLKENGELSVHLTFIQAKNSPKFDSAMIGQSLDGIENIFKEINGETILPPSNEFLDDYRQIIHHIYSKSAKFKDGINPTVDFYYATLGTYNNGDESEVKIAHTKHFLEHVTGLISSFNSHMVSKGDLQQFYKNTKSKIEATLQVDQKLPLPDVKGIEDSYLCLIPLSELKKLFVDSDGKIINEVFYDNVRAYQGDNSVNKAMKKSLSSGEIALFTAMNNGISIVCPKIKVTGWTVNLVDYQIVNGCQTCNVLQQSLGIDNIDQLVVAVKLIASTDKDILQKIIVANNSQTEVKREQLLSLLDSQRVIEDYYNAQNKYEKLYYERRSKQYRIGDSKVPIYKVVTIPNQIQSFVSMIMGEPNKVRGYYGSIVEQYEKMGKQIFSEKNNPALYYTSALAYKKLEEMFSNGVIDRKYKKIKFQILLAFRLMCEPFPLPGFNDKRIDDYCDHLCKLLCNEELCKNGFDAAVKLVDNVLQREPKDSDSFTEKFTKNLKRRAHELNVINHGKK